MQPYSSTDMATAFEEFPFYFIREWYIWENVVDYENNSCVVTWFLVTYHNYYLIHSSGPIGWAWKIWANSTTLKELTSHFWFIFLCMGDSKRYFYHVQIDKKYLANNLKWQENYFSHWIQINRWLCLSLAHWYQECFYTSIVNLCIFCSFQSIRSSMYCHPGLPVLFRFSIRPSWIRLIIWSSCIRQIILCPVSQKLKY